MTKKYAIEALLRPPVELYSAVLMFLAGSTCFVAPSLFVMPEMVAYVVAVLMLMLGVWRLSQGMAVIRYQRGLRKSPNFKMKRSDIPVNRTMLYLGRGFEWLGKHTQRVHDAREDDAAQYVKQKPLIRWLRQKEIQWDESRFLRPITKISAWDSPLNPVRPLPPIGGEPMLHGVGVGGEIPTYLSLKERSGHLLVKGTTGVGKTRLAELFITQDIRRKGNCVIILDPKGDADLLLTTYIEAIKCGRKCYVFHLGFPEYSARYNAVGSFSRITEIATRISSPLPGDGDSAAFKEFVWWFVNVIAVAAINMGDRVDYQLIRKYMRLIDPLLIRYGSHFLSGKIDQWEETFTAFKKSTTQKSIAGTPYKARQTEAVAMLYTLQHFEIDDPIIAGLIHAFQYEKSYFDKITTAVGPFLEKLSTGKIAEILSPRYDEVSDNRPIIDWEEVIRQESVVYVGLDALTDPEVASVVGSSMFSDLTSFAGRKTKFGISPGLPDLGQDSNPSVIIHGDEFNDLIGPHMVTLLNKSRSADYQLNLYTQTWSDVEAKLGNAAKAGQVAGNLNTTIMMRVKEISTAEMLTKQLPETNVNALMAVSGVDDGGSNGDVGISFKSKNEDRISTIRVPLITPSDIVGLPVGQAFAMLSGSHLHKIRIPLLGNSKDLGMALPEFITEMVADMRGRYRSTEGWYKFSDTVDVSQLTSRL